LGQRKVQAEAYKNEAEATNVFFQDLLEACFERIPLEYFDVLLDDAGLGYREIHEDLEKLRHPCSGDGGGM
jgi:hypothetical protein